MVAPIDDPRWWEAVFEHGTKCRLEEWARRPELPHGSSPWAEGHADAHDCIMVRIQTDLPHISVRREIRAHGELPSDPPQTGTHSKKLPVAVHYPSACSGLKACPGLNRGRCETQAPLGGKPPSCASVSVP